MLAPTARTRLNHSIIATGAGASLPLPDSSYSGSLENDHIASSSPFNRRLVIEKIVSTMKSKTLTRTIYRELYVLFRDIRLHEDMSRNPVMRQIAGEWDWKMDTSGDSQSSSSSSDDESGVRPQSSAALSESRKIDFINFIERNLIIQFVEAPANEQILYSDNVQAKSKLMLYLETLDVRVGEYRILFASFQTRDRSPHDRSDNNEGNEQHGRGRRLDRDRQQVRDQRRVRDE